MSTETIRETESAALPVQFETDSKPDPIIQLIAIALELQKLCPKECESKDYGKYVSVDVGGYKTPRVRVYFDSSCHFPVDSLADLKAKIAEYDPTEAKRKRIESLRAELSKLEGEQ